jgi:hypothetical protein
MDFRSNEAGRTVSLGLKPGTKSRAEFQAVVPFPLKPPDVAAGASSTP